MEIHFNKKKRSSKVLFRLVLLLIQLLVYSLGNLLNYIRLFLLVSPKKVGKSAYYIILFLGLIRVTDLARLIFTAALIADLQVLGGDCFMFLTASSSKL